MRGSLVTLLFSRSGTAPHRSGIGYAKRFQQLLSAPEHSAAQWLKGICVLCGFAGALLSDPKSWVGRRNSLRQGVYISDFQTADKVAVEVLDAPADGDIRTAAVTAAVIPPGRQEDATLNLPAQRLIKSAPAILDGQDYLYLEFPSETTTRSGYNIKRKNFVVAGVKKDKLYVLSASAGSDQYNEEKKEMLQHIVQSFRLR